MLLGAVVVIPQVVSGPGNDLDVANIFRSGRAIARHGTYQPSRAPGAPVHETIVGVLDLVGGPLLTNLASVAAAVVLAVALDRLLVREGVGAGGRWATALVVCNPWFLIAATSTTDYVFALAFVVLAALALRNDRPVLAGALAAASMGSRIGTVTLVAAVLLAELGELARPDAAGSAGGGDGDGSTRRTRWVERAAVRRSLIAGAVCVVVTAALFVPSVVEAGGLAFAQNDFSTSSLGVQLGRAAVKMMTLLGAVASVVALAAIPAVIGALRGWRTSWLVRFAVPGLVLSAALFIRFPWKMTHLLPCLLCGAVLLAVALDGNRRLLLALVALQLVYGVVRVDVVRPDDPNRATGGTIEVDAGWGPLVRDWQCRRDHEDAYRGRQKVEVEAAWNCARPFGG